MHYDGVSLELGDALLGAGCLAAEVLQVYVMFGPPLDSRL